MNGYIIERVGGRHPLWYVCRYDGTLVCACAYRKGAEALVAELAAAAAGREVA